MKVALMKDPTIRMWRRDYLWVVMMKKLHRWGELCWKQTTGNLLNRFRRDGIDKEIFGWPRYRSMANCSTLHWGNTAQFRKESTLNAMKLSQHRDREGDTEERKYWTNTILKIILIGYYYCGQREGEPETDKRPAYGLKYSSYSACTETITAHLNNKVPSAAPA